MDIIIACIGHMKPSPELDLLSKYIKQTRWNVVVREFEDKKPGSVEERKKREGALLLSAVPAAAKIVVMDERGKLLSSEKFAKRLGDWRSGGCFPDRRRGRAQRRNQEKSQSSFSVRGNDLAAYVGARHAGRTNLPGKNYFGRTPVPPSIKDISLSI